MNPFAPRRLTAPRAAIPSTIPRVPPPRDQIREAQARLRRQKVAAVENKPLEPQRAHRPAETPIQAADSTATLRLQQLVETVVQQNQAILVQLGLLLGQGRLDANPAEPDPSTDAPANEAAEPVVETKADGDKE